MDNESKGSFLVTSLFFLFCFNVIVLTPPYDRVSDVIAGFALALSVACICAVLGEFE